MVSQCDFLRSWPTFASRDRLQPVCSRCRRRARCCLKDQKSQNLGILKEISKEIFAMSLSPWDPSPNRNAPAPSKSLQSSSRPAFENIPSIRYVRTCATTTTWRNVRQRTTTSNSLFCWGHRLGGMWSRRLRRRRLLFLPSPWSNEIPWETQFSEEETNPSFEIFFTQTQLISVKCWFVQILRSKPKADLMSVDCRIHSPSRIRTSWVFWSPFCYVMTGVEWLSFKLDATLRPLVFSAPQGSTPTKPLPQKDIHQLHTCNQHPHYTYAHTKIIKEQPGQSTTITV